MELQLKADITGASTAMAVPAKTAQRTRSRPLASAKNESRAAVAPIALRISTLNKSFTGLVPQANTHPAA